VSVLAVRGAHLYYEVTGSGPVLLLIHGGYYDAESFADVSDQLADSFTVVRYDRRGASRSHLDGPPRHVSVQTQTEDARQLLSAIDAGSAYVFGTSWGALTALTLTTQYPDMVRAVVAHEPQAVLLLPESDPRRAQVLELENIYRQRGLQAAAQALMAAEGLGPGNQANEFESRQAQARWDANFERWRDNAEHFFGYLVTPGANYLPDFDILGSPSMPATVVAVGQTSTGKLAHEAGLAVAARLGRPAVTFPAGHNGYLTHPVAFASKLRGTLDPRQEGKLPS